MLGIVFYTLARTGIQNVGIFFIILRHCVGFYENFLCTRVWKCFRDHPPSVNKKFQRSLASRYYLLRKIEINKNRV